MIKTDIASDIKAVLGDKYKIYVDNNSLGYINIDKDMTIEKQIADYESHIVGIFRTQAGEIVALKDLFSSSFSFSIDFIVPIESVVTFYDDVDILISTMNGSLNDNETYRYIITFNSPIPLENTGPIDGVFYQKISLTGFIAHSDQSMFGNDFQVFINEVEVKGVISHNASVHVETDIRTVESGLTPQVLKKYVINTLSLTMHTRLDDTIASDLMRYIYYPQMFEDNPTVSVRVNYNGNTRNWLNAVLIEVTEDTSIGGYVILSCTLMKTVI
ncbi:hypothetical protein KHQ81_12845 [Mycoplasmatota bacterium]|nr:hypothetical protein KHQ81_12845 [Mycoplasmatota bacterium]